MIKVSTIASKNVPNPYLGEANHVHEIKKFGYLETLILNNVWTPGVFKDVNYSDNYGKARKGRRRNKDGFLEAGIIALDIDETYTLEWAREEFRDYKHIIATTKSHLKEKNGVVCERFRVVLFTAETIDTAEKFYATSAELAKRYPGIDTACGEPARFFFPCNEIISSQAKGAKLKVLEGQINGSKSVTNSSIKKPGIKGTLARSTLEFIAQLPPHGTRHNSMMKALFDMKENGYSKEEANDFCQRTFDAAGVEYGDKCHKRVDYVYANSESRYEARWPQYKKSKGGSYGPDPRSPENYEFLINSLYLTPKYNKLFDKIEYPKPLDFTLATLQIAAQKHGLSTSKDMWMSYLLKLADDNKFHPINDILDSTEGGYVPEHDYIKDLASTIKGPDRDYIYLALRRWLVGCMAKINAPNGAQNLVLVFKGAQGIGKSRWLERLTKEFENKELFGEAHLNYSDKDTELIHLRKFIFHVPELEVMTTKRESGELKSFLTKNKISVREAYQRGATEGYSKCNFCASVNNDEFLVDLTGNRRFIILEVTKLDSDHKINMLNVFRQARALWQSGEQYWFNINEISDLNERNYKYLIKDPIDEAVEDQVVSGEDFVPGREILDLLGFSKDRKHFMKLKHLLKRKEIPQMVKDGNRGYAVDRKRLCGI